MKDIRQTLASLLFRIAARVQPITDEEIEDALQIVYARADHWKGVALTPLREDCEQCSRRIVAGFEVGRRTWEAVAGERRSLCLACFDALAESLHVRYALRTIEPSPWFEIEFLETRG